MNEPDKDSPDQGDKLKQEYDVIVVGGGNAAITAAISANENNAKVLVIEKASKEERGGNTRFTGGVFRIAHNGKEDVRKLVDGISDEEWNETEIETYPPSRLIGEIMKMSANQSDPDLLNTLAEKSYDTAKWMKEKIGVKWVLNNIFQPSDFGGGKKYRGGGIIKVEEEGIGLSEFLFDYIGRTEGIDLVYSTKVTKILKDGDRVCGVRVQYSGKEYDIKSKAVILGSGGFQANTEMRKEHMGEHWTRAKVRGTKHNTGEVTLAALEAGAQKYGAWNDAHATPIDARSPDYGDLRLTDKTSRYSWLYGALLNVNGDRFIDEGTDFGDVVYAKLGKIILAEPESIAYQVFDQKVVNLLEKRYQTTEPILGDTWDEILEQIKVNHEKFRKVIEDFNAAVNGSEGFDPTIKDGKSTKGLNPEKTNWAMKLDKPPYVVYPVTCGVTFTFGGIRINTNSEVLDSSNKPIAGLYASGEIAGGFFYNNYPGGTGLVRGAVFGRTAGRNAAKYVLQN